MAGKRNILANLFGAQFLVNLRLSRNWPFLIYCFCWIIFIIFMEYNVRDILIRQVRNDEVIKTLRSEYISIESDLQFLTQKGEVTRVLKEMNSTLKPSVEPPKRIKTD